MPFYDFLLFGDYFFDMIYTGMPRMPKLGCELYCEGLTSTGGAMFITAAALRRLGADVGWPAIFGNDEYSGFVRDLSLKEGLDPYLWRALDVPYRRVTTSLAHDGERAFVSFVDPDPEDMHDFWLASMERCTFRHLHFGGAMSLDEARQMIESAHTRGATVSMDCQDTPLLNQHYDWSALLGEIDLFMPNAREAKIITSAETVAGALEKLGGWCKLVVVKDGANGAWAIHTGEIIHTPAIPVGDVVDTTGAGDCFNAGFLFGHVVKHLPLEISLLYGNICGGFSVGGVGGATNAPTYKQFEKALAELTL